MEHDQSAQAGHPWRKSSLDEWFLRVHSLILVVFVGLLILLGAWQYASASTGGAVPSSLDYSLRAVFTIAPAWAVGIGLFSLHVGRMLRVLYPYPESSAWTHYVLLTKLLVPIAGLTLYRRMRAAYDESARTERPLPSPNQVGPESRSATASKARLFRGTRLGELTGDVIFAVWPLVVCWLLLTLRGRQVVMSYSDLKGNVTALTQAVLCGVVAVVGLWTLIQVDRFERGWQKLVWWALVVVVLPLGATLYWFCRLRRTVRSGGDG
jgi:hypothetical protein